MMRVSVPLVGRFLAVAILFCGTCVARSEPLDATLTTNEKRDLQREGRLIVDLLQNLHYSDRQFHEMEGKEIIDAYLTAIDSEKSLLLAEDVAFIHRRFDRTFKTVYLLKGDFQPALEIFDTLRLRARERVVWAAVQLSEDLKLDGEEVFVEEPANAVAGDAKECDRRWTLRLKNAVIGEVLRGRTISDAKDSVRRSHERWMRELAQLSAVEVRERFLESLINLFDPHSGYFSPEHAEDFQIMMKGAIAGVGLDVWVDEGECHVAGILPAGPADVDGTLHIGDQLLAFAEETGAWTELKNQKPHDVDLLLRGKPGTKLRLAFRNGKQGDRREVELIRQDVVLVEQRARGGISKVTTGNGSSRKIGWIELPDFYAAGETGELSSATRDVRELIEQMNVKGIEGLVIDLRRNPGGAMTEAVSLTGLFIPTGTVVLERGSDGTITGQKVTTNAPAWDGPLVVLTSRDSASASEVFAGAVKFHERAIVVGAPRTFGKGTAQNYIDLNRSPVHGSVKVPWGTLRVTAQRFYFPDGHSPQRAGAAPHIVMESVANRGARYEEDLPHALSTDDIPVPDAKPAAGKFARATSDVVEALRAKTNGRTKELPEFSLRKQRQEWMAKSMAEKEWSLNLERRRREKRELDNAFWLIRQRACELAPKIAFETEAVETRQVKEAIDRHISLVKGRVAGGADGTKAFLSGSRLVVDTAAGGVAEVRLEAIEYARYVPDAPVLATRLTKSMGRAVSSDEMAALLEELGLLEHATQEAVQGCFEKRFADGSDRGKVRAGVEDVLRCLTELDPALLDDRPMIDVGAREGLRLAADWAELLQVDAKPAHVASLVKQ